MVLKKWKKCSSSAPRWFCLYGVFNGLNDASSSKLRGLWPHLCIKSSSDLVGSWTLKYISKVLRSGVAQRVLWKCDNLDFIIEAGPPVHMTTSLTRRSLQTSGSTYLRASVQLWDEMKVRNNAHSFSTTVTYLRVRIWHKCFTNRQTK